MFFTRPESDASRVNPVASLAFALLVLGGLSCIVGDEALRANGLYGTRVFAAETVVDKRMSGSRRSRMPTLYIRHRGELLRLPVLSEQYEAVSIGQRLPVVIVSSRVGQPGVFLDTPGLKLDPRSRFLGFAVIMGVHFALLFGVFRFLLKRARDREAARLEGFGSRRLGLGSG